MSLGLEHIGLKGRLLMSTAVAGMEKHLARAAAVLTGEEESNPEFVTAEEYTRHQEMKTCAEAVVN